MHVENIDTILLFRYEDYWMGGVEARMASPELQSINERGDELDLNTREAKRENT